MTNLQAAPLTTSQRLAMLTSLAGALIVATLSTYIFAVHAPLIREAMRAGGHVTEARMLGVLLPVLFVLGCGGALSWALTGVALRSSSPRASAALALALVTSLISGFMPIPPSARVGVLPWPSLVMLAVVLSVFVFVARRGLLARGRAVALAAAMAFAALFGFLNTVASTHRVLTEVGAVYALGRPLFALGCLGWILAVASALGGQHRARLWLRGAAGLTLLGGIPVAVTDSMHLGRLSMFAVAPVFSAVLLGLSLLGRGTRVKVPGVKS